MSPSDVEALRNFVDTLNKFRELIRKASEAGKRVWTDHDLTAHAEALIQRLKDGRVAALRAAKKCGATGLAYTSLGNALRGCVGWCEAHKGQEEVSVPATAYQATNQNLRRDLDEVTDWLDGAEVEAGKRPQPGRSKPKPGPKREKYTDAQSLALRIRDQQPDLTRRVILSKVNETYPAATKEELKQGFDKDYHRHRPVK